MKLLYYADALACTLLTYIRLSMLKAEYGKNVFFFGLPKLSLHKGSTLKIGNNCKFRSRHTSNLIGINRPCILSTHLPDTRITVGNNCGFSGTVIGCFKEILIGNNVRCGANTLITDSDWHLDDPRSGPSERVVIEDNVWLSVNSTVLKGVTIGAGSIIGAGSVVTADIPPHAVAAGNPCRVIRLL